jgi:glutathione S-transferase
MRIYRIPYSTNVERVALALGHKGQTAEWIDVDPADRGEVRRVSGQELVPVLDDGGEIVVDSPRILLHLEQRFPDPPLYPAGAARRAEVLTFIDWFNRVWKAPPNEIEAELSEASPDEARIAELGALMRERLDLFEQLLTGREYLMGEFGAADCVAFPFLKYAVLHDEDDTELFHRILSDWQQLEGAHPRLEAWIHRVDARPRA